MIHKQLRPSALETRNGLGIAKLASSCTSENTKPLAEFQAAFIAGRYGMDAHRARLVAQLAWGER